MEPGLLAAAACGQSTIRDVRALAEDERWWRATRNGTDGQRRSTRSLINAEANRRITFRRYPIRAVRAHLAASGLFVLAYLTTSGAVLIFRHFRPATVAAFRVPTSAARQASRNDLEFCQG
ncbi:hypothetical protein [Streptomyces silvisoli]|uniref:Uncharacterized protein n=1 Tax=Streptomyces silvisoli TaxID=3034235 RepID=A0ABT5ZRR1_9ACTN|nr:hypothetical protein [Streptomyces silvisoli]MDF3292492.1 hypothetical protein [Streptomyces silvisoli]